MNEFWDGRSVISCATYTKVDCSLAPTRPARELNALELEAGRTHRRSVA